MTMDPRKKQEERERDERTRRKGKLIAKDTVTVKFFLCLGLIIFPVKPHDWLHPKEKVRSFQI